MNIFGQITKKTMLMNKSRTIVTIIGVILATAMVTAVVTLGTSIQKFMYDYLYFTNSRIQEASEDISKMEFTLKRGRCRRSLNRQKTFWTIPEGGKGELFRAVASLPDS